MLSWTLTTAAMINVSSGEKNAKLWGLSRILWFPMGHWTAWNIEIGMRKHNKWQKDVIMWYWIFLFGAWNILNLPLLSQTTSALITIKWIAKTNIDFGFPFNYIIRKGIAFSSVLCVLVYCVCCHSCSCCLILEKKVHRRMKEGLGPQEKQFFSISFSFACWRQIDILMYLSMRAMATWTQHDHLLQYRNQHEWFPGEKNALQMWNDYLLFFLYKRTSNWSCCWFSSVCSSLVMVSLSVSSPYMNVHLQKFRHQNRKKWNIEMMNIGSTQGFRVDWN